MDRRVEFGHLLSLHQRRRSVVNCLGSRFSVFWTQPILQPPERLPEGAKLSSNRTSADRMIAHLAEMCGSFL
jgi:hypothetical protein